MDFPLYDNPLLGGDGVYASEMPKVNFLPTKSSSRHNKVSFMQALLSNILNPKTVLVFITVMPQFIDLNGNVNQQLIVLALILTLLVVSWFLILVYVMDYEKNG